MRWESSNGVVTPKVCRVLRFVLVKHPRIPLLDLRLAICAVYGYLQPLGRMLSADASHVEVQLRAVEVDTIDCNLIVNWPNGYKEGIMYFMPDTSMTDR